MTKALTGLSQESAGVKDALTKPGGVRAVKSAMKPHINLGIGTILDVT
jgi:hypothetical protein